MNYYLTGQSGFIGQAITKRLLSDGHSVYPLSKYISTPAMSKLFEKFNPDYIMHIGAYGNHYFQTDFRETVGANILRTYYLLEASKAFDYKLFYNFSTSSVKLKKQTYYSITKYCGEQLASMYRNTVNIHPYSVYGEGEADHRFIPKVIKCLHTGESMVVDGDATHDWIYIDSFVDALFAGETEIGTGVKTSNKEIVKMLEDISGKSLRYVKGKVRDYDNDNWVAKKGVKDIGIYEGLKRTYEYFTL
jgi:nucleoside-diphosphate-sugar epimerase